jgi:hypothetical protein
MKKAPARKNRRESDVEMRSEYNFDFSKSRPNRFASQMPASSIAVVLDPDVAAVFKSSESVNTLLRSVIAAMPGER